jgi:hypothetical protein
LLRAAGSVCRQPDAYGSRRVSGRVKSVFGRAYKEATEIQKPWTETLCGCTVWAIWSCVFCIEIEFYPNRGEPVPSCWVPAGWRSTSSRQLWDLGQLYPPTPLQMAPGAAVTTALQHAIGCAQAGRWRECVDGYRSAYTRARRETSGPGTKYRLYCLSGASTVLIDGSCAAGADDVAFFSKVRSSCVCVCVKSCREST